MVLNSLFTLMIPFVRLFPLEFWVYLVNKATAIYGRCANRYSVVYEMLNAPYSHWITKDEWKEQIELPFECLMVPAPRDYDVILSRMYGEYNKYPSPKERGVWHEGVIHFEPDIPYKGYLSKLCHDAE